ncbi:MAG: hypothetical protein AAF411_11775 [Myxococcota bacterium]
MILRSLSAERAGALKDAERAARRALRSARSEELVSYEVFASLVLARQRRRMSKPFFARHVLEQLAPLAPALWGPWLAWERTMCGAVPLPDVFQAKDVQSMRRALDALAPGRSFAEADRARLRAALFGSAQAIDGDVALLEFVQNPDELIPVVYRYSASGACAYVRSGARLTFPHAAALDTVDSTFVRSSAFLKALALAGDEGLTRGELFRRAYGFAFDAKRYGASFRVALHRLRRLLPPTASLDAANERLILRTSEELLIPDASSSPSTEERVALLLVEDLSASAREISARLDISKRSAQRALRALTERKICRVEGNGAARRYVVEDSTFEAMTRTRHRADELVEAWGS